MTGFFDRRCPFCRRAMKFGMACAFCAALLVAGDHPHTETNNSPPPARTITVAASTSSTNSLSDIDFTTGTLWPPKST